MTTVEARPARARAAGGIATFGGDPDLELQELDVSAEALPGRLIVVEGIDGSGKSTQIDLLYKWLVGQGYLTVFTEWNSSPATRGIIRRGKRRRLLTPMSFSMVHAADFADRLSSQVLPAMHAGAVVLADRYIYTAFARDAARGVPPEWLRHLYSFAATPTLALYFDVPLEEALRRITTSRARINYYEAGMDLGLSDDIFESFRLFQGRVLDEYESLSNEFELTRIDATKTLVRQQKQVRALVMPHLEGVRRMQGGDVTEALRCAGLSGRYMPPPMFRSGGGE